MKICFRANNLVTSQTATSNLLNTFPSFGNQPESREQTTQVCLQRCQIVLFKNQMRQMNSNFKSETHDVFFHLRQKSVHHYWYQIMNIGGKRMVLQIYRPTTVQIRIPST